MSFNYYHFITLLIVSIPKGEATNPSKSLILLYQDYTPLSMFLYRNIYGKLKSTQKNQAIKAYWTFPSIQLLPEVLSNPCAASMKPYTNQILKFCHRRSTDMTFGQNVSFMHICCINSHLSPVFATLHILLNERFTQVNWNFAREKLKEGKNRRDRIPCLVLLLQKIVKNIKAEKVFCF